METEPLTDTMLRALRSEAANAGDTVQVDLCDAALDGDHDAAVSCAEAISANRAMDTDLTFVRVVVED